jgi:hypothetical protein
MLFVYKFFVLPKMAFLRHTEKMSVNIFSISVPCVCSRVARWFVFKLTPKFLYILVPFEWKMLKSLMTIWYAYFVAIFFILWNSVYFVANLHFGILYQEKSGSPASPPLPVFSSWRHFRFSIHSLRRVSPRKCKKTYLWNGLILNGKDLIFQSMNKMRILHTYGLHNMHVF